MGCMRPKTHCHNHETSKQQHDRIDRSRRHLVAAIGGAAVIGVAGVRMSAANPPAERRPLRWGVVGTGSIAGAMAPHIRAAKGAELSAVSSRRMTSARKFAAEHGVRKAFDAWERMIASDNVDAIYVATPTSVREAICVAAAKAGKHVLGEKPFASLESVQRIAAACRAGDVGFMDATHFVHHPRTAEIRRRTPELVGTALSLASAFQVPLEDRDNIRFDPGLEPMGALGDLGWYNLRAAVEYLSPDIELSEARTFLRRDPESGAAIAASGAMRFSDGSTTTFNAGFESGAVIMDLRLTGPEGAIVMDDFVANQACGAAAYTVRKGGFDADRVADAILVPAPAAAPQLMFEDFAAMVGDTDYRERSIAATERTQALLDAAWHAANSVTVT